MSTIEIGLLATLALTIIGTITAILGLLGKIQEATKDFVIEDENGKKKLNSTQVLKVVISAITAAEQTALKGADKKELAVETAKQSLIAMGVDFDINDLVDNIEKIVSLVNVFIKKK